MSDVVQLPPRLGVTVELERVDIDRGRLVVRGVWSGVRGMRFVRPTLVVGDRQILATLEHKPWAPDGKPWIAAFPWEGDQADLHEVGLAVAPSVTVWLGPPPATPGQDDLGAVLDERDALRALVEEALDAGRLAEAERDQAIAERDAARAERDEALRYSRRATNSVLPGGLGSVVNPSAR